MFRLEGNELESQELVKGIKILKEEVDFENEQDDRKSGKL